MVWNKPSPITELTGPHRLLYALLRHMGFEVENEVPVGKYRLDCFIRDQWIGFECDGKRIHAGVRKQQKDADRDKWIWDNAGIPIMRIQSDALQFTLWEDLKPLIIAFMEEHGENTEERRAKAVNLGV